MPTILLHSDLHLESGPFTFPAAPAGPAVAVFAGDVCSGGAGPQRLAQLTELPKVYVAGNHEFWGGDYFERLAELKARAAEQGVHFLENRAVVLGGVRFLGATLWTDYGGGHEALLSYGLWNMRDHAKITAKQWWTPANRARFIKQFGGHALETFEGNFNPLLALELHRKTRAWLKRELAKPFAGPTVVVTHHAPHTTSLLKAGVSDYALKKEAWVLRRNDDLNLTKVGSYASSVLADLHEELTRAGVRLWCHGHLHQAMHYAVEGIQVAANPRGRVHPPLTPESARGFALFGMRISEADIERSQKAHQENPEAGDGFEYDKELTFSLDDSGYAVVAELHEEVRLELACLMDELKALRPLVRYKNAAVADLAAHRADTLWLAVLASVRNLTEAMQQQLGSSYQQATDLSWALSNCKLANFREFAGIENRCDYSDLMRLSELDASRTEDEKALFGDPERHSAQNHLKNIEEQAAQLARAIRATPHACTRLFKERLAHHRRCVS